MATRPTYGELSRRTLMDSFTGDLIVNPDELLRAKGGGDYALYQRVLADDQCKSTFQQRRMAVTHAETIVEPGGTTAADKAAAEFFREQMQALEWDDKCDKMLYGIWYGHAIGENIYARDGKRVYLADIKVRPAGRFRYANDYLRPEGRGIREVTMKDLRGEPRPERKYWTFCSGAETDENPYGMGLARDCYWPSFFKKNDIKFWLYFLERFGQPTAKGSLPRGMMDDDRAREDMLDMLEAIQQDSVAVVPADAQVELIEASRNASADYAGMKKAMDEAIAKLVLGQTLTSENTGGQYKAEMQKDVRDEIVRGDSDLLCNSFNRQTVRWLTEWNFPNATPPKVWRKTQPDEDINARAERDTKLVSIGFRPTPEKVEEVYGDGYEPIEATPPPPQGQGDDPAAGGPSFAERGNGRRLSNEFAEGATLLARRALNRQDQAEMKEAARRMGFDYETLMDFRQAQLLEFLEGADDLTEFRNQLRELAAEEPPEQMQKRLLNTGFFARLTGARRNQ